MISFAWLDFFSPTMKILSMTLVDQCHLCETRSLYVLACELLRVHLMCDYATDAPPFFFFFLVFQLTR